MNKFISSIAILALTFTAASAFASGVCKYNDDDGTPARLYKRIALDPADFYSPVVSIQFCDRADVKGNYVIIEEELIKGFNVRNPALAYTTGVEKSTGLTYYVFGNADGAQSGLALLVSKDGTLAKAYKNGNELVDVLKLVDGK